MTSIYIDDYRLSESYVFKPLKSLGVSIINFETRTIDSVLRKNFKSEKKSECDIKKVILVDKTGLTIASVSKFSYFPADVDGIGAIASAVFIASEKQGKDLELGDLKIVTCEVLGGKIFASSCGSKTILTLVSDPDCNDESARLILKRFCDELKEILDEFLSDFPDILDLDDLDPDKDGDVKDFALA